MSAVELGTEVRIAWPDFRFWTRSGPSPSPLRVPSVDPLTRDLPGPRIEHQAHRGGPVVQEGKAGVVAARCQATSSSWMNLRYRMVVTATGQATLALSTFVAKKKR